MTRAPTRMTVGRADVRWNAVVSRRWISAAAKGLWHVTEERFSLTCAVRCFVWLTCGARVRVSMTVDSPTVPIICPCGTLAEGQGWWTIERPRGGGGAWLGAATNLRGGLGKGAPRAARPIPHYLCPRRAPRAREVSEGPYIHRPVSTGKGGVHKKGLHCPPALGAPPPEGGGLEQGLQAPPPPPGGAFQFSLSPILQ